MRLGHLGPAGTFTEEAAARRAPRRRRSSSPTRPCRHGRRRARRRGRRRAGADRELAGGRGHRDPRRAERRARGCAIVGEAVLADPPVPDRRASRSTLGRDRRRSSRTRRRWRSARASCASGCPARALVADRLDRRGRAALADEPATARGDRLARRRRRSTAAWCCARASRTSPATPRASPGSPRDGATAFPPAARGRRVEDLGRCSPAPATRARAGSCAACRSSPSAA